MKLFFVSKSRLTVFSGYAEEGQEFEKARQTGGLPLFLCLPERCFKSIRVVCQFLDSKLFGYQSDDAKEWKQADSCSELRDESLQRSRGFFSLLPRAGIFRKETAFCRNRVLVLLSRQAEFAPSNLSASILK